MKLLSVVLLALLAVACGSLSKQDGAPTTSNLDISTIPDATPRVVAKSKYGNPASYSVFGKRYSVLSTSKGYRKKGIASWYGTKFHGRRTSSGEPYDMYAMTAAHKSLPLPTFVRVTNLKNKKSIVVKVNDRGPFHKDRIIDLSYAAAIKLNIAGNGTGFVEVVAIDPALASQMPADVQTDMQADRQADRQVMAKKKTSPVVAKTQNSNNLFVQIGAFAEQNNARGVQSKLLGSNINNVKISQVGSSQKAVFRVRVGPLVSVKSADKIVEILNDLGYGESTIVVE